MPKKPEYLNAKATPEKRASDLLKRMTLEEKVGQLVSTCPVNQLHLADYSDEQAIEESKKLIDLGVGQLGVAVRHATAANSPKIANAVQRYARENTRLGIPVLIQDECVHGCKANGSTMFPQSIGMAASWNPDLMERLTHAIAKETSARGINQAFSPTLNVARDVRCGRVEETYGEDPLLISRMAVAFVKILQKYGIASTPKHFVANFVGDGGRDSHAIHFSERILREIYFPGFKAAVKAGAKSIMIAHTALDGIPCSNNHWLIDTILRKEWGFTGFIVPDNTDVQKNFSVHSQAKDHAESTLWCLQAGMDTDMSWPPPDPKLCYIDFAPDLVRSGKLAESAVDACVKRVLRVKFEMGLFENPYVDEKIAPAITQCPEHRALALESAVQGTVLLKNDGLLPIQKKVKRIAVMGPSSDKTRLGGYTCENPAAVTPLQGLRARAPAGVEVVHVEGCKLVDPSKREFAKARKAAKNADLVILCMGNSSDKVIGQPETTEGERHDRCNLDLPGVQEDFILEIVKANPNTVVCLQNGSAITMRRWLDAVPAIVEQWYAGAECGNALAKILWGDANPAGRLPLTFPASVGQLPLYYNPRPHGRVSDYMDHRGKLEQFEFGFGLSYTRFTYADLKVRKRRKGDAWVVGVNFSLENTGNYDGDEVVQLYLRDVYCRITRPIKELKAFERVSLRKGERKQISLTLTPEDFSFLDENLKPALEAGDFRLMIGASSCDIRLETIFTLSEKDV